MGILWHWFSKDDGWPSFDAQVPMVIGLTRIFEVVEVLKLASSTNLFGLGCPFYCGPFPFSSLTLALIISLSWIFSLPCSGLLSLPLPSSWLVLTKVILWFHWSSHPRPAHLRIQGTVYESRSGLRLSGSGFRRAGGRSWHGSSENWRWGLLPWVFVPTLWCPGLLHQPDLRQCLQEAGLSPRWLLRSLLCPTIWSGLVLLLQAKAPKEKKVSVAMKAAEHIHFQAKSILRSPASWNQFSRSRSRCRKLSTVRLWTQHLGPRSLRCLWACRTSQSWMGLLRRQRPTTYDYGGQAEVSSPSDQSAYTQPAVAGLPQCWSSQTLWRIWWLRCSPETLEDQLSNEMCLAGSWRTIESWRWRRHSHINLLEAGAVLKPFRRVAESGGDKSLLHLCDSHVARMLWQREDRQLLLCWASFGRSVRRALLLGFYPAERFAPAHWNPGAGGHATRDIEIPEAVPGLDLDFSGPVAMTALASFGGFRGWISNWLRLCVFWVSLSLLLEIGVWISTPPSATLGKDWFGFCLRGVSSHFQAPQ